MDSDSWSRFSTTAKRYQSSLQSRYNEILRGNPDFLGLLEFDLVSDFLWLQDLFLGFEDIDGGEEEPRAEFPCPFCSEDFDIVGLCCHIDDEHPAEAKNGVCPVCAARVGMDLVSHLTMQHQNFFKMQRRWRFRRGSSGSHSTLSLLRKELREGNLQAIFGGSSYTVPPSNAPPDPLLSSLIYTLPVADQSMDIQPESVGEESLVSKNSDVKAVGSLEPSLSEKDKKERSMRSEFVQGLLLSTLFDDASL